MGSAHVELIIRIPNTVNHVVYAILHDEVLTGRLLQIDISERDGIWYIVQLDVYDNQKLTCEFCDDDIRKSLFLNLDEAKLALKNNR